MRFMFCFFLICCVLFLSFFVCRPLHVYVTKEHGSDYRRMVPGVPILVLVPGQTVLTFLVSPSASVLVPSIC